jgi:hypothetical protein
MEFLYCRSCNPGKSSTIEQRLAQGFGDVRIHEASHIAVRAGAQAVTEGIDIHFAPRRYRPRDVWAEPRCQVTVKSVYCFSVREN